MQLQAYSVSNTESDRDYVLYCEDKFEVESEYDGWLVASEAIIWLGSIVIFMFFGFKLCSSKEETVGEMWTRVRSWCSGCRCGNVNNEASASDGPVEQAAQHVSTSGNHQPSNTEHISTETRKTYISIFMIIIIVTVLFLVVDVVAPPKDILTASFAYNYGIINFGLIFLASILILFVLILYALRLIIFVIDHIKICRSRIQVSNKCKEIVTCMGTILTFASFLYILSRMFIILLAFATYPYDVGFALLAIGSIVIAFLFVAWAAFHITADSCKQKRKWQDIFISLTPYMALFLVLFGFLLSYLGVILSRSIHPADPVTSLASTLFPGIIAFIASSQYDKQRKLLSGDATEQPKAKKPIEMSNSSSKGTTEQLVMRDRSSPSADPHPPEVVSEDTSV